jgi:truncated hemoglobin YjbI
MKTPSLTALAAAHLLCLTLACSGGTEDDTGTGSTTSQTGSTPTTGATTTTGDTSSSSEGTTASAETSATDTTCDHLGGMEGIAKLVDNFLGLVVSDDRINAYFLKNDLDLAALATCVTDQLGAATGCVDVVYTCKPMLEAHADLGISTNDFMDFAADFTTAWDLHAAANPDVTPEDYAAVLGVFASIAPEIVEDADSNLTVYQRVGRKPNIKALVGDPNEAGSFVALVAADATINGFFGGTDFARLNTCLTRQIQGIDGPDTYGRERDGLPLGVDPGASQANPCRDMMAAHAALIDPNDAMGISLVDFVALVDHLGTAMTTAEIPMADQDLIRDQLGALCPMIVTIDPMGCM